MVGEVDIVSYPILLYILIWGWYVFLFFGQPKPVRHIDNTTFKLNLSLLHFRADIMDPEQCLFNLTPVLAGKGNIAAVAKHHKRYASLSVVWTCRQGGGCLLAFWLLLSAISTPMRNATCAFLFYAESH